MKILLKEIREGKKITLRQLQQLSGVSSSQINAIENGNSNPTFNTLCKIAKALKIEIVQMFNCNNNCNKGKVIKMVLGNDKLESLFNNLKQHKHFIYSELLCEDGEVPEGRVRKKAVLSMNVTFNKVILKNSYIEFLYIKNKDTLNELRIYNLKSYSIDENQNVVYYNISLWNYKNIIKIKAIK